MRNNWLELYFQNNDWLDKPHFPFWITALFFKVFGIHTWSYKLPGILFALLGAYYTYLFAKQLYTRTVALWSVLILLTAEHIIISNTDVRAEPFLTGLIIASVYHFHRSFNKKPGWHLLAGSLFAACAVMTKGVFTLIPIGGAIAGGLIITRNWKELFHWRWLAALLFIGVFIIPELYSLWYQFDRHPEKTVFGKTNVSGIRFFLWDSQFGRFFNTGPITGKGDPFFFVHTLLWAFLPWSLVMYAALIDKIRAALKKINLQQQEWFTFCGSILTLFVFSVSKFQLPHYANIIFPFLAILTASYISKIQNSSSGFFTKTQYAIIAILFAGGILLHFFYSPAITSSILLIIVAAIILLLFMFQKWLPVSASRVAFYRTVLAAIALNLYIIWFFYPHLLKYQSGSEAAFYMNKNHPDVKEIHSGVYAPVFEFYINDPLFKADTVAASKPEVFQAGTWYVNYNEFEWIKQRGLRYEIIKEMDEFPVTMLTLKFINKKTRSKELKKFYLIRLL